MSPTYRDSHGHGGQVELEEELQHTGAAEQTVLPPFWEVKQDLSLLFCLVCWRLMPCLRSL